MPTDLPTVPAKTRDDFKAAEENSHIAESLCLTRQGLSLLFSENLLRILVHNSSLSVHMHRTLFLIINLPLSP